MSRFGRLLVTVGITAAFACVASAGTLLTEDFENVDGLTGSGWSIINNSNPVGPTSWFQGDASFLAQAGTDHSYAAANFLSTSLQGGDISTWLITPVLLFDQVTHISFYTRTEQGSGFPDRLELRLSLNGASGDVGTTSTSTGDFLTVLATINPGLQLQGYPENWALVDAYFTVPTPTTGRVAFRYFVTDTASGNGDYVGVDTLTIETVPEPGTIGMLALGGVALWMGRRRINRG